MILTGKRRESLRAAINDKCRDCIYDSSAPGTWRQQVTLCSSASCPLWYAQPQTDRPIPTAVLRHYHVLEKELQSRGRKHLTSRPPAHSCADESPEGHVRCKATLTSRLGVEEHTADEGCKA